MSGATMQRQQQRFKLCHGWVGWVYQIDQQRRAVQRLRECQSVGMSHVSRRIRSLGWHLWQQAAAQRRAALLQSNTAVATRRRSLISRGCLWWRTWVQIHMTEQHSINQAVSVRRRRHLRDGFSDWHSATLQRNSIRLEFMEAVNGMAD